MKEKRGSTPRCATMTFNAYRKPAEREPGPTKMERLKEWWRENRSRYWAGLKNFLWRRETFYWVAGAWVLLIGFLLISVCLDSCKADEAKALAHAKEQLIAKEESHRNRMKEMKALCAPDHFQTEMKIGDELYQVSCVADTGLGRLIYREHK